MDKILVHICCGVDAIYALRKIKEEFPDAYIEGYFYDPNIHPEEEYELRWIETLRVCNQLGINCEKAEYDIENWLSAVRGLEEEPERGKRCTVCHDVRLEKTAKRAKEKGFNKITTVLMMSPKKDFQVLKSVGENIASEYGLEFLAIDFRKNGGIEKMNRLSKESQLYHQNYCGCMFALFQQRKAPSVEELICYGKGRLPGSREELLFIKKIRVFAENLGIKCREEEFDFIKWRAISSIIKVNKTPVHHTVLWGSQSIRGILRAKITEIIETEDKKICKLNKSNTQIWILKTPLREFPLEMPRYFTHPIFILGEENQLKEGDKVELQLKTIFDEKGKSQNLYIGYEEASEKIEFYSDTLPDGTGGFSLEEIKETIIKNREKLISGELKINIYGAETAGKLGRRFHEFKNLSLTY